jgi:hypothetical protein
VSWQAVAGVDAVAAVAYLAIAWTIGSRLVSSRQLRSNRLGVATGLLFLTGAVHHGAISVQALLHGAEGFRDVLGWSRFVIDGLTALAGIHYLSLRGTYASVLRGAQMFEDLRVRERQALEINDNIVQGLTVAKYAMSMGSEEQARTAIEDTLVRSRQIITDLLGEEGTGDLKPGDLRRSSAATVVERGTSGSER